MPARESKALRSVVADLAQLRDEDVQAILAELDVLSRNRLSDLLDAYRNGDASEKRSSLMAPPAVVVGSWLSDRLTADRQSQPGRMTVHAVQALQQIATAQGWSNSSVEVPRAAPRSLVDRMVWRS